MGLACLGELRCRSAGGAKSAVTDTQGDALNVAQQQETHILPALCCEKAGLMEILLLSLEHPPHTTLPHISTGHRPQDRIHRGEKKK